MVAGSSPVTPTSHKALITVSAESVLFCFHQHQDSLLTSGNVHVSWNITPGTATLINFFLSENTTYISPQTKDEDTKKTEEKTAQP